ncbi:sulfatase-like hydrolase/transferase [Thalassotalea fonticola]|uniref:Sulfatase-like hydrolase/transferase n=1 Tax=Thalassotalea fonticola TaxID=3065649 RepID=A0ABZ0GKI0_9GAMM|nr:sulfatase-like hydrolase/transferase [Colwelliaceae bacterium S1-1]
MMKLLKLKSWLALALFSTGAVANELPSQPNIIVIVSDDQGYADIGASGLADDVQTPNIDRLAKQGTRFTSAYVTAPICNVSRLGLITGTYNQRQGAYWYGKKAAISDKLTTIAEVIKTQGYTSGYIGKYHYGSSKPDVRDFPLNHGFDYFYGYGGNGRKHFLIHDDAYALAQKQKFNAYKKRGGKKGQLLEYGAFWNGTERDNRSGFSTEIYGEKAREFVKNNKDNKFYLQLAFNSVHNFTHQLPEDYLKANKLKGYHDWDPDTEDYYTWYENSRYPNNPEGRAHYLAQLEYMDKEIGKLFATIDEQGLGDDTVIIFVSDNGGSTPIYANNGPLRGSKYTLYEGGIRVPMMISWPGTFQQGVVSDNMVSTMDILPTLANLAGAQVPEHVDGQDITTLLTGENVKLGHQTLVWDTGHETAVRQGKWKFKTATDGKYAKYEMVELELGTFLYNLDNDPAESVNLANKHPEIVKRLSAYYQQWQTDIKRGL